MEQLLLYQMDMEGMASSELFPLANVSEVPVPVRARDAMKNGRSTPCPLPVWVGQHAEAATVHSLFSADCKLRRSNSPHSRLTHQYLGKHKGLMNECYADRVGWKLLLFLRASPKSGFLAWLCSIPACICKQHFQELLLKKLPTSITLPSFSQRFLEPGR